MNKIFILRPKEGLKDSPWEPWYDKCFGFVIEAVDEASARQLAQGQGYGEVGCYGEKKRLAWTDEKYSTCKELKPTGDTRVIISDVRSA